MTKICYIIRILQRKNILFSTLDVVELYFKLKKSLKKDLVIIKDVLHVLIVIDHKWINYKFLLDLIIKSIARRVILKFGIPLCL